MDTVILAAGRNSRLQGVVAPGYKPLLVVNGKSLVRHAVDSAEATRVIVVASPENAQALSHVLPDYVEIILQRRPGGPGNALEVGLRLVETPEVLVLMADNLTPYEDVKKVVEPEGNVIGVRLVDRRDAQTMKRFTRLRSTGEWVEKVPVTAEDVWTDDGLGRAWIGPIKLVVDDIRRAIRLHRQDVQGELELPIGPFFNHIGANTLVEVDSVDVGVPEELP